MRGCALHWMHLNVALDDRGRPRDASKAGRLLSGSWTPSTLDNSLGLAAGLKSASLRMLEALALASVGGAVAALLAGAHAARAAQPSPAEPPCLRSPEPELVPKADSQLLRELRDDAEMALRSLSRISGRAERA